MNHKFEGTLSQSTVYQTKFFIVQMNELISQ